MKRSSIWTTTLAIGACLTTATWAQHGGGAGIHGDGPANLPASSHASDKTSSGSSSSGSANFETRIADNPNLSARLQPLLPPTLLCKPRLPDSKTRGSLSPLSMFPTISAFPSNSSKPR